MKSITSYKAILFDLDGTLLDSVGEIADAVNDILADLKLKPAPIDQVQSWIGNGARVLLKRALAFGGLSDAEISLHFDDYWAKFYAFYAQRSGKNSTLYPQVSQCLSALKSAGLQLAVVTNKGANAADIVLRAHGIRDHFSVLVGGDSLANNKPHPLMITDTLEQLSVDAEQALFIGDSMVDVNTGKAAKVDTWAFKHGYHHGDFDQPLASDKQPPNFRYLAGFDELQTLLVS